MEKLCIVVDSSSDLSPDICQEYGIINIPLKLCFGNEVFLDRVDLPLDEFYQRLESYEGLPTTSQATPVEFVEVYRPLLDEGYSIISLHISGKMSGTVQSARLAKNMLNTENIEIIDTDSVSVGYGIIALRMARAIKEGKTKAQVLDLIEQYKKLSRVYFVVGGLEHLHKGGRIGTATAFLGSLLNVKPLLTVKNGVIHPQEKVRGKKKALDRMIHLLKEEFSDKKVECFVVYGYNGELAEGFKQKLEQNLNCSFIWESQIGGIVCTHGGPDIFGMVCLPFLED